MFANYMCQSRRIFTQFQITQRWKSGVRIGCASGFWGDTPTSSEQLVMHGNIDYLVSDYLSEITMSLLTAAKRKNPEMGYAPDFVHFAVGPLLKQIKEKNIKVLSNAGGTNPLACAEALMAMSKKMQVDLKIAVVTGDDMMPMQGDLKNENISEMFTSKPLPSKLMSMNAYYGSAALKHALDDGADIVITGRCVDSCLVLAPLMHEFDWKFTDYNKLAAGSLAGHLLECGAQSTGGIFTDWKDIPDWHNIGFPIAECEADGNFIITKPPNTGGTVNKFTVAEQLVYEIDDPSNYMLPDVSCDFSNVNMVEVGKDQVKVTGAVGTAPSDQFKICATHLDGFRCTAVFLVNGKNAVPKGHRTAQSILKRVRGLYKKYGMKDFRRVNIQAIGDESLYGNMKRDVAMRETMVWMAMEHDDKKALQLFTREIAAAGTGMAPGLCAFVGGRPKISPVLKLYSFLYNKSKLPATIQMLQDNNNKQVQVDQDLEHARPQASVQKESPSPQGDIRLGSERCILEDLAYARSGDKGNCANIGVIARHPSFVPYLQHKLTSGVVLDYFRHLFEKTDDDQVVRYELPGVDGFNFYLRDCLGGGGVASLRTDPQGKGFAQMLLDVEIDELPTEIIELAAQLKSDKK